MKKLMIAFIVLVVGCTADKEDLKTAQYSSKRRQQAPIAPTPEVTNSTAYFGMHILGPLETNVNGSGVATLWPSWNPATVRLWNTYGYNSTQGKYTGIAWANINTSKGAYDWNLFDKVIAKFKAKGVTSLVYTIGNTPAWAGPANTKRPTDLANIATFITQVSNRAISLGLPITSWEIWNEPNATDSWTGTTAEMVEIAKTVYNSVKSINGNYKVLTPSPQGYSTSWMDSYLSAGGGAYADVVAFHGYMGSNQPESIATLVDMYKNVEGKYGQDAKPLWNTEAMFWGAGENATEQSRFLAVTYLLCWIKGVERYYWYSWDQDWGKEWTETNGLNAVAKANQQIINWVQGATLSLTVTGSVYEITVVKSGITSKIVWNSSGSSTYSTTFTKSTDLSGNVKTVSGSVSISKFPVLLSS
jgi:hypothetical protein